jgi:hypothetical protein
MPIMTHIAVGCGRPAAPRSVRACRDVGWRGHESFFRVPVLPFLSWSLGEQSFVVRHEIRDMGFVASWPLFLRLHCACQRATEQLGHEVGDLPVPQLRVDARARADNCARTRVSPRPSSLSNLRTRLMNSATCRSASASAS